MKKTFTVNLNGAVYHIDEDAYELLDNYLSNLRIHFSKEEGAEEIVHDMEARISELFSERLKEGKQVITAQGGLSVAGGCRCLTKDGNTSIEKEGYIPYPLQA